MDELKKLKGSVEKKDDWLLLTFFDESWETREQFMSYDFCESQFFKLDSKQQFTYN
jgi:hypothetical protein